MTNPVAAALRRSGDLFGFCVDVLRAVPRRPFQVREFVQQAWFISSVSILPAALVCWFPLLVSTIAFGYAAPGLQASNFLTLFGANDRLGGFFVLASIREFAPFVTAIVLAGVAGTAITADLGARKIREELDAMQVLGIDPVQRLVVPRVAASMLVSVLLNGLVSVVGVAGGYLFNVVLQGGTPGAYLASFQALGQPPDLIAGEIKALVFGAVAATVAAYKGMTAGGGPKGVGDAVNQSVVITFMLLFALNFVITAIYFQVVPQKGS